MGQCISGGSAGRRVDSFAQEDQPGSSSALPQSSSESSVDIAVSGGAPPRTSIVIKLLRSKKGRRRVVSVRPRKRGSPSGLTRRAKFNSMNKAEPELEDTTAQESPVEPHAASASNSKNTPRKKPKKSSTKSVTFVEPEVENNGRKPSEKKFRSHKSRKPLKPSNRSLENDKIGESSILIRREKDFTKSNLNQTKRKKGTNGTDSDPARSVKANPNVETMGINFSDDGESVTGHHRFSKSHLNKQQTEIINWKTKGASTTTPKNNTSSLNSNPPSQHITIASDNCNFNKNSNNNCNINNTSNLTGLNTKPTVTTKSIDIIREEIRLRRNLFFGTPGEESQPSSPIPAPQNNGNMSGCMKTFAFKPTNDRDIGPSKYTMNRLENNYHVPKTQNPRSTEIPIPKLYSVQSCHQHPISLKSNHSNLPVVQPSSRLPVFSSGSSLKNTIGVVTSKPNVNQRNTYARIPSHPLRAPKYLDPPGDQKTAGQWISGKEFFVHQDAQGPQQQQHDQDIRRETLPSKFGSGSGMGLQQIGGNKRLITDSSNTEIRRGSVYTNWGSKLPMYNSEVKKPAETVPFYMMGLYKSRNAEVGTAITTTATTALAPASYKSSSHPVPSSAPFSAVSTGVVKQRAIQYQTKISQLSGTEASPPSPLVRSSTFTKSTSPLSVGSNTPVIPSPTEREIASQNSSSSSSEKTDTTRKSMRKSLPAPGSTPSRPSRLNLPGTNSEDKENRRNEAHFQPESRSYGQSNSVGVKRQLNPSSSTEEAKNYPLARDPSTSSSVASSEEPSSISSSYATADADKAISDSEFLIDDEISDQPELTLTFKDSSLILSPSTSGESLISCDLMLDYKDSSCSGVVPGDSVLLVDEPSLLSPSSPKLGRKANNNGVKAEVVTAATGVAQVNMVNTGANSSNRRSFAPFQSRNGTVSPIPSSIPLTPSNKLSSRSSNRTSPNNSSNHQSNDGSRLYHPSQTNHGQRRSSGLPIPVLTPEDGSFDANKLGSTENHHGSPRNSRLRPYSSSKSPLRQSLGNTKHRTVSPSPKSNTVHRTRESSSNSSCKDSLEGQNSSSTELIVNESVLDDSFIQDILLEVTEYKSKLKDLLSVLETNERDLQEKDEIIGRQQKEIAYWKARSAEKCLEDSCCESSIILRNEDDSEWHKEKELSCRKETVNSAVQTENNYMSKPAVMYPDENDKVGQLVSFRIGRNSSASNKS